MSPVSAAARQANAACLLVLCVVVFTWARAFGFAGHFLGVDVLAVALVTALPVLVWRPWWARGVAGVMVFGALWWLGSTRAGTSAPPLWPAWAVWVSVCVGGAWWTRRVDGQSVSAAA